jgi:hypothetical protein
MSLGRDPVTFLYIGDKTSDLNDISRELVSNDEGRFASALRPGIPVVDVYVGAAHAGATHPDQNLVFTERWLHDILQSETGRRGFLYQRFHLAATPLKFDDVLKRD